MFNVQLCLMFERVSVTLCGRVVRMVMDNTPIRH